MISGLIEKVHPFCFLRETNLTKTSKNIIEISKNIKNKNNKIKFCHNLNSAVYKSIKVKPSLPDGSKDLLSRKKKSLFAPADHSTVKSIIEGYRRL